MNLPDLVYKLVKSENLTDNENRIMETPLYKLYGFQDEFECAAYIRNTKPKLYG